MIPQEIYNLKNLLVQCLGESKKELDDSYQLQFACPRCIENKGDGEKRKFNLEVNLKKGVFNCWSCGQFDEEMHGSILKLFKLYGNDSIIKEYKDTVKSLQQSKLYQISFENGDFNIDFTIVENNDVNLPNNFTAFNKDKKNNYKALDYLLKRGITWDIINKYKIGYTKYDENFKQLSSRIIIPSFNKFGELNYWTGRDFTNLPKRQKYYNPIIERKNLIFNEEYVEWDADITLVEGPFDHIVVPNSIPLLGKVLKTDFKLYQYIITKANANVNIWLDSDAFEDIKKIYQLLNHDRLYGKIKFIPTPEGEDPSSVFQKFGKNGVIECLKNAKQIDEIYLG